MSKETNHQSSSGIRTRVRNDQFDPKLNFSRGAGTFRFAAWQLVKWAFFRTVFPWPVRMKVSLLRFFGCRLGVGVVIKPQVNIHLPWKLQIGDHAWIGEEVYILNFEPVKIGSHVCISQRAFICAGNHDYRTVSMVYRNAPIVIEDGVWIGAHTFVAPGVVVGVDAVVAAGSVLVSDATPGSVYSGNPAKEVGRRWREV
ncbi:MAG: WcaF family extracellular polysaccharide biosynthesis acetyltransferase [Opitutaceae bacterium]|jgi:putative colanic acid biosynthesis acetyltransferase WcaF